MLRKGLAIAAIAFVVGCTVPVARAELLVASGVPDGTYHTMMQEIIKACTSDTLTFQEVPTTGAEETISLLLEGNSANVGILQTDGVALRQKDDSKRVSNLRVLMTLHPEEVHFVVPAQASVTRGGKQILGWTIFGESISLSSVDQLAGKKVGVWGGSAVTAKAIQWKASVPYVIVEYPNRDQTLAALMSGEVDAIMAVGGQPLKWLKEASTGKYRLVSLPQSVIEKLTNEPGSVYRQETLYYRNLDAAGLATVATDALLVTRAYKGSIVRELNELRQCIIDKLPDFQEEVGHHQKWQQVDPERGALVLSPFMGTASVPAMQVPAVQQSAPVRAPETTGPTTPAPAAKPIKR